MIAIVNYKVGNLGSLLNMLRKAGAKAQICETPEQLLKADRLILPGVGHFGYAMGQLEKSGLIPPLKELVFEKGRPLMGVCVGHQLLFQASEEGECAGLGWLAGKVQRFRDPQLVVPHMGWNEVEFQFSHPVTDSLKENRFYFAHSFHAVEVNPAQSLGLVQYGQAFPAVVTKDHILGVQFHPEKSHRYGLELLSRFSLWSPM